MLARAALLRVTGVAVGSVAGVAAGVTAGATFVFFAGFAATLVRFELFVALLVFLFAIVCPLHGTREPYACRERSKVRSNCVAGALLTMQQRGEFFTCNFTCKQLRVREGKLRGR